MCSLHRSEHYLVPPLALALGAIAAMRIGVSLNTQHFLYFWHKNLANLACRKSTSQEGVHFWSSIFTHQATRSE